MYFNIISKIINVYDKNIKFNEKFCSREIIRGVEHKIFEGRLTYKPEICVHCKAIKQIKQYCTYLRF